MKIKFGPEESAAITRVIYPENLISPIVLPDNAVENIHKDF